MPADHPLAAPQLLRPSPRKKIHLISPLHRRFPNRPMSAPDSGGLIPDDLIPGILSWLPAKSLMRFKSVSKFWKSIVMDSSFAKDHLGGFRGLLFCSHRQLGMAPKTSFYHASLDGDTSELCHYLTVDHRNKMMRCTEVVNGLVCFYHRNFSCLFNVATGESMALPLSTHEDLSCHYYFGFDPVKKLYKLLKIYPFPYDECNFSAYLCREYGSLILTIGVDSSWRPIEYPHTEIRVPSVCIDGVLYWMEPIDDDEDQLLIAFDLDQEKFLSTFRNRNRQFRLLDFAPSLALISSASERDDYRPWISYGCYAGIGKKAKWRWDSGPEFKYPPWIGYNPCPQGILPNGKVLILKRYPKKFHAAPICLLDPFFCTYKKILLHTTPSTSLILKEASIFYHEENIVPLKFLISTT